MQKTKKRPFSGRLLSFAAAFATAVSAFSALPALPVLKAQAAGSVTLSDDGTLTLSGAVTREQVWAYRENDNVLRVVAADDCVLPADCSWLFCAYYIEEEDYCGPMKWRGLTFSSIDLSGADTSNVTTMRGMFADQVYIQELNVSGWDTSNVTDMGFMFCYCGLLTELDLSSFDTANVTDMSSMFESCDFLTELDVSSFDTANVTDMDGMFYGCDALTELDLSSFDTSNVTQTNDMFYGCSALTTIYVSDLWNMSAVSSSSGLFTGSNRMFYGCTNLVGGNGTVYDSSKTDKTYARIDSAEQPGYLTDVNSVTYELSIAGTQVTFANKSDILGNSVFSYDDSTKTLAVMGSCSVAGSGGNYNPNPLIENSIDGLTIDIQQNALLKSDDPVFDLYADTTLTGAGYLTVLSTCGDGISVENGAKLTISDLSASVSSQNSRGIAGMLGSGQESLYVRNSSLSVRSAGSNIGAVYAFKAITLDGCSIVSPEKGKIVNGYIAKSDGSVASNVEINKLYGLRIAGTDVTRSNKSDILGNGVFSFDPGTKTLHIHGDYSYSGTIIDNESYGINSLGGLTVCTDSESTLTSGSGTCIRSNRSLTITGEMLHLRGRSGIELSGYISAEEWELSHLYLGLMLNKAELDIQTAKEAIFCCMIEDLTDGEGGGFPDYYPQDIEIHSSEISVESQDKAAVIGDVFMYGCSIISPENAEAKEDYVEYLECETGSVFVGNDYAKKVVISAKTPVSAAEVTLSKTSFPYTGSAVKVGSYLSVKYNGTPLTYGTDFTTSYANNTNCGYQTASVTVKGKGNYTGSVTLNYSIFPKKQAKPTLSMDGTALHVEWTADSSAQGYQVQYCKDSSFTGSTLHTASYTGKTACTLSTYPKLGETWYVRVRSYITDSAGTKYGFWSDTASKKLTTAITSVTLSKTQFAYTGSAVKVGSYLTVKCGDTKLTYGTDYTTSYTANTAVGYQTATVTVKGTGKYSGTFTKKYTICPKKEAKPALSMSGTALHVEWTADPSALAYQIEYCKNSSFSTTDASYHTVTYTGKTSCNLSTYPKLGETWYVRVRAFITNDGKTTGTKYGLWSDAASKKLASEITSVTLSKTEFNYTGSAIAVGSYLTVKCGDTKLTYGTDYTTSYAANKNSGVNTAKVTVTGTGKYTGSFDRTFTIVPAKQAKPTLTAVSGGFKAEWTADANAIGYELVYCKDSSFTGDSLHSAVYTATSATLKKYPATGEKWYVKVRAVISSNGTTSGTLYGTYSAVASVTAG